MKKLLIGALIIIGSGVTAFAQSEVKAKEILAEVSKKYRSYDVIKTEFSYTLENPQAKIKETQSGTLFVRSKVNKYKSDSNFFHISVSFSISYNKSFNE